MPTKSRASGRWRRTASLAAARGFRLDSQDGRAPGAGQARVRGHPSHHESLSKNPRGPGAGAGTHVGMLRRGAAKRRMWKLEGGEAVLPRDRADGQRRDDGGDAASPSAWWSPRRSWCVAATDGRTGCTRRENSRGDICGIQYAALEDDGLRRVRSSAGTGLTEEGRHRVGAICKGAYGHLEIPRTRVIVLRGSLFGESESAACACGGCESDFFDGVLWRRDTRLWVRFSGSQRIGQSRARGCSMRRDTRPE